MSLKDLLLLGALAWVAQSAAAAENYGFAYSTFGRAGLAETQQIVDAQRTLTFRLGAATFDKTIDLEAGARPIAFVPPTVTVRGLTLAFAGAIHPEALTLDVEDGRTLRLTAAAETAALELRTEAGTLLNATAVTYAAAEGEALALSADAVVTLDFSAAAAGGAELGSLCMVAAGAPHLLVTGAADLTRHVFAVSDGKEHLLSDFSTVDAGDQVIVVEFSGDGGTLEIDRSVAQSPLVLGSVVPADQANVYFSGANDASFTSTLTLRDGEGADGALAGKGGLSLFGPEGAVAPLSVFNPSFFLLQCDATLCTPLPYDVDAEDGSWFQANAIPIPAGRTFRIAFDGEASDGQLPNVSFAAPDSRLELASKVTSAIPQKYLTELGRQSGTLVIDRDVRMGSTAWGGRVDVTFLALAPNLETTLVLKSGTLECGDLSFEARTGSFSFASVDVLLEGGTLDLSGDLAMAATTKTVTVGKDSALTADAIGPLAEGTSTDVTVEQGGMLTLTDGLGDGRIEGALGGFDLHVRGTLTFQDVSYFQMLPAERRTLYLEGGTIASEGDVQTGIVCGIAEGGSETVNFMDVIGGGTLSGNLTVDGVSGSGTLTVGKGAIIQQLRDYDDTIEGSGAIGAIEGARGTVLLGGGWLAEGGKTLADAAAITGAYSGTLGFTAGTAESPKTIDFSTVAGFATLGMAFRVNDYQHIIMRLDQYADATIRWPANPQGVTLTLIESGAYGGSVEIPHVPAGVKLAFRAYPEAGGSETTEKDGWQIAANEDGVKDTLTWEKPVFSGAGAWFDVEFNRSSANIGWFTLRNQTGTEVANGMLRGDTDDAGQVVMTDPSLFVPVAHPADDHGGLPLRYCPYVSTDSLDYPDVWSVAVRLTAPAAARTCILALGGNYAQGDATDETFALVFATGETNDEIVLWKFDGVGDAAVPNADTEPLFRVRLAEAQAALHLFSVVCDGQTLTLYMDGAYLNQITLPEGTRLAPGLQVGRQLGGSARPEGITAFAQDVDSRGLAAGQEGVIDYIRFYKGALTDEAMQELADRTPYVRENLRYVRKVPAAGYTDDEGKHIPECWIQTGAWLEQTWDNEQKQWVDGETTDQPAEGAECRLLVAPGSYTIQVNVERQVQAFDEDGQLVNQGRYFYSPNRNYATLVVAPQEGAGNAGTLHLTPLGVTADEGGDTMEAQPWEEQVKASAWYTERADATAANRTGFRYGRLRFTGGAEDAFSDDTTTIEDFHGAGYLLKDASGCYDAGACYFSKYANMVLPDAEAGVLRLVAGMSLTRGVVDEVARWQLTGPVVVEGSAASDRVQGHEGVAEDQASEDVWVPFFTANSSWKFYDDTRLAVNGGEANVDGAETGLFARGVQTPGRLYLDFTVDKVAEGGAFSTQAWYRYGYNGAAEGAETPSGMAPVAASADDFLQAVAFQIRLAKEVGDVTLTLDQLPTAQVQTFYVEEEAEPPEQPLTLRLKTAKGVGPLVIHRMVVAAARLDVSNEGSDSGNALSLTPGEGLHVPVHRGPDTAGRGAFIVGDMTMDWDFGRESSVARLEVAPGHTLTFRSGQDFRTYGTTLVAQERATIHHTSAAPLLGQDVELHKDATFGFHAEAASQGADVSAEGVVLEGALTLRGSATLRASQDGGADDARLPHFTAAGGIVAAAFDLTLTVEAPEGVTWHSHTGRLEGEGFGLCKTGPGTVDFYLQTPPSVTGPVAVEAGTLRVAMAADTPIGAYGLHVAQDATLADNGLMQGSVGTLARIPNGQTLSGTGTIADGRLRLEQGATYQASAEGALTAEAGIETDSVEGANITVALPDGYEADKPFLVAGREERAVRRRLRSMREGVRWDTVAWIEGGQTSYAARPAQIPAPTDAGDDPGVYDEALHGSLVNHYQGNGVAYVGAAQGRTQAKTKCLNASELSDVFYAFSGVYALLPSAQTDAGREWIDAHNLHVAYEFGIDAMAFAQIAGEEHVVVRVRVRNALRESFDHLKDVTAPALDAEADFRATATLRLADAKGTALEEAFEVADLTGTEKTARASAEPGVRYLALPVAELPKDGRLRAHVDPVRPSQGE